MIRVVILFHYITEKCLTISMHLRKLDFVLNV